MEDIIIENMEVIINTIVAGFSSIVTYLFTKWFRKNKKDEK